MTTHLNPQTTWTQCPQCLSVYALYKHHLQAADGWVQCAHCQQIFLALSCLVSQSQLAASVKAERPLAPTTLTPLSHDAEPTLLEMNHDAWHWQHPHHEDSSTKPVLSSSSSHAAWPGFALIFLGLLASAFILLFVNRNVLAAWAPQWRPSLMGMCKVLGCEIDWPTDLSALSIESSAFEREHGPAAHYLLSLKLKNSNDYTLKAPRIKLILTDENDTVLNTLELSLSTPESVRVVHPGTLNQWMLPVTFDAALDRMPNGYRIELESP